MSQGSSSTRIFWLSEGGPKLRTARDATDVIGRAYSAAPQWIAIPVSRLDDDFFRLSTGVAGGVISKFVGYGMRVAFIGDISQYVIASESFRDFVREANRGSDIWFVADLDEFDRRLSKTRSHGAIAETQG